MRFLLQKSLYIVAVSSTKLSCILKFACEIAYTFFMLKASLILIFKRYS